MVTMDNHISIMELCKFDGFSEFFFCFLTVSNSHFPKKFTLREEVDSGIT